MRILLAEDDESLGKGLITALKREGLSPEWIRDGGQVLSALQLEPFELLILDLGLPGMDGTLILKKLRESGSDIGVLILTARDRTSDKVLGLNLGADDYLVKPFELSEFFARLHAVHRRRHGRHNPVLQQGALHLDPAGHQVTYQGEPVELGRREFSLLQLLLENRGRVLSREHIEQQLYRWGEEVESNSLEVHIHNLRKKFYPQLIRTVRGIGYVIDQP